MGEPPSSRPGAMAAPTTFHGSSTSGASSFKHGAGEPSSSRSNARASSSSSSRINATASSSSSAHRNAEASSSRHRDMPETASPGVPTLPGSSFPWFLGPLAPLPPLADIFERMNDKMAFGRTEGEMTARSQAEPVKAKERPEEKLAFMYTEVDVVALVEGLSSEDGVVFDWAIDGLHGIMEHQAELLHSAVLPYLPSILALIPTASSSEARCQALLGYVCRLAGKSQESFDVLETHMDIEELIKLLKKSSSTAIRHVVLKLLDGMMQARAEGDRRDDEENWEDVDDEDSEGGRLEGGEFEGEANGLETELEKRVAEALRSTRIFQFDTLEDDSAGNGKGKAKASRTVKWNVDDALNAIGTLEFVVKERLIAFCTASMDVGALDFLLSIATTPNSDTPRSPSLTNVRVAAVSCLSEIYLAVVEIHLTALDFPYECSTDDDDASLELQGRILMPLLGIIDDVDSPVSDKVVEVLYNRFDDLDEAVQIFLWSSEGSAERLVHKYALGGAGDKGPRHGGLDRMFRSGLDYGLPGMGRRDDKGKAKAKGGFDGIGLVPDTFGMGSNRGLPGVGGGLVEENWQGPDEVFTRRSKADHPNQYSAPPRPFEHILGRGGNGIGEGKRIKIEGQDNRVAEWLGVVMDAKKEEIRREDVAGERFAPAEMADTVMGGETVDSPLVEMVDMGTAEGDAMSTRNKGKGKGNPEMSNARGEDKKPIQQQKKRSFSDMLGLSEPGQCSPTCPHAKHSSGYPHLSNRLLPLLDDAGIGSKTSELLLERLIERNPDGVTEAFRAFWERKDIEDWTKESLLRVLSNPLGPMTVKMVAMSAGLPVHVEMEEKAGGLVMR